MESTFIVLINVKVVLKIQWIFVILLTYFVKRNFRGYMFICPKGVRCQR